MKVLLINGSPRRNGCTVRGLKEIEAVLHNEGVETAWVNVPADCPSCMACNYCYSNGECVRKDVVNEALKTFKECDGLIVGTPVYYAGASGSLMSFLDRFFYSKNESFNMKAAAAISSSRRAGNLTSNDMITKFFSISGMNVITSTYWNDVHGFSAEDVEKDEEGLQTMRNIGHNMAYYLKMRKLAKENGLTDPIVEKGKSTHFIR